MDRFDVVIVGTGPAGLGAAFHLTARRPGLSVLVLDREKTSTGGLRNDCKMNFTYPVGFPLANWTREQAEHFLNLTIADLQPSILDKHNVSVYCRRAAKLGVDLLDIRQAHFGTDGGLRLIERLMTELAARGVHVRLEEEARAIRPVEQVLETSKGDYRYGDLVLAPGRHGSGFLQSVMESLQIPFVDHVVDIGIRVETTEAQYPIVRDYYDPKFFFPEQVRTFCTNSRRAYVSQERYEARNGQAYGSVNGHAYAEATRENGLVNFALLRTVMLTEPVASGQQFAEMLGLQAMLMGGGRPIMQRVGDFRLGKRSKAATFNGDLYHFRPSLDDCCPGDISMAVPAKILRGIWRAMKLLDTIVPGVLHPSTIMYYPEIKLYGNKPVFIDGCFQAKPHVYLVGDGAGTSRGITAAWASGIRAATGILGEPIL
ncbi:MAG: pyridine nucleotide-disulfide oxidoreductase [Lentisphaerae bacterium RIFOXYB12_FULL_65_16]|nr:MAG: pyridine nucleotide-disulfide oxidoreductase [Lentisphaerae bacterium RIFOXYA12_64_32]OGV93289.1 MAG: pyridine nucleotide-disulfide oxidoreductase [Lentisphaerae bacterium RIFOXYB12_FULL_65_16]